MIMCLLSKTLCRFSKLAEEFRPGPHGRDEGSGGGHWRPGSDRAIAGGGERLPVEGSNRRWRGAIRGGGN